LKVAENTFGLEHPYLATSLNNLVELNFAQGKYDEAEPLFKQSLTIYKRTLGWEHPDVAIVLRIWQSVARKLKRKMRLKSWKNERV